jgi:Fe-S cluster assembly protein SufD
VDAYRQELRALGKQAAEPAWLTERRASAFARFASRGFPTRRDEAWRQTNVARIAETVFASAAAGAGVGDAALAALPPEGVPAAVFVDGRYVPERSRNGGAGVEVLSLREVVARAPSRLEPFLAQGDEGGSAFADLNAALNADGAVVFLAPGATAEAVHLVFLSSGAPGPAASHPRSLVVAGKGSRARLVESYAGPAGRVYLTNAVVQFQLEAEAHVEHYRLQREGEAAYHVGRLTARVGREAQFSSLSFSFGAALARHDLDVALAEEGAACALDGLIFADGERHTDVHTRIDHLAPRGTSREHYRGILDGRGRGVFHGLVIVRPGAQKTDALQANRNLLLSREALVSSTPQLEILADDVKCKHGSTTGQLDPAAVFYLRSRGLGEAAARALLTRAFAGELLGRLALPDLRAAVERELGARLGGPAFEEDAA